MAYILDILAAKIQPRADQITLERYVLESSYITRFVSRVVKDKALVVYQVLFHLSWFETGKGEVVVSWAKVGSYIRSEQGNIIEDTRTVKRRLPDLFTHKCIAITPQRAGANAIAVHLPSDIPDCRDLIEREARDSFAGIEAEALDTRDYYSDPVRRVLILERDVRRCVYCTVEVSEDTFVLDHLVPITGGGTNRKFNLITACSDCNRRKGAKSPLDLLLENYRGHLLGQDEFITQKAYVERLLADAAKAG